MRRSSITFRALNASTFRAASCRSTAKAHSPINEQQRVFGHKVFAGVIPLSAASHLAIERAGLYSPLAVIVVGGLISASGSCLAW
jgi:hypothetical protein